MRNGNALQCLSSIQARRWLVGSLISVFTGYLLVKHWMSPDLTLYISPRITMGRNSFRYKLLIPRGWDVETPTSLGSSARVWIRPGIEPRWWLPSSLQDNGKRRGDWIVLSWDSRGSVKDEISISNSSDQDGSGQKWYRAQCSSHKDGVFFNLVFTSHVKSFFDATHRKICSSLKVVP
jgi:hypothetical protein